METAIAPTTTTPRPLGLGPHTAGTAYCLLSRWQTYLKFNGKPPRTLAEKLQARADCEHARRTAEIKKLAAKLALLEPMLPGLAERGTPVHDRDIYLWNASQAGATLNIMSGAICCPDDKLMASLLDMGFREIDRKHYHGPTDDVILKHGRALLVRIKVSEKPATAATPTAAREEVAA